MLACTKVPKLRNPRLIIRLACSGDEIAAANHLVCENYVDAGIWNDDRKFQQSPYHHSEARAVIIALEDGDVVATASIIVDSKFGLPADTFQPRLMRGFRLAGDRLAEVSALAVAKSYRHDRSLVLFLYKYLYQYSFHYVGIDRFVASSTPRHAIFYESVCGFQRLTPVSDYSFVRVDAQFLTAHLIRDRLLLAECYGVERERPAENDRNFYHFLLLDEHPNLHFPVGVRMHRSRDTDWLLQARLMSLPVAV